MTPYVLIDEYLAWITQNSNGGNSIPSADRDEIEGYLEAAQDYIEEKTGRWFEGRAGVRYYDGSAIDTNYPNRLLLDMDLLTATTVTNGDGAVVAGNQRALYPYNELPKWGILHLNGFWSGSPSELISVDGVWGMSSAPSPTCKRMVKRLAWIIQSTRTSTSTSQTLPDGTRIWEATVPPDIKDWILRNTRLKGSYDAP